MQTKARASHLTSNRLLATNTLWNLLGQGLPMLVALVSMPILIGRIGAERFAVLSLASVVIGYFGLFDFGTGKALTKVVADRTGADRQHEIPMIVWTALACMALIGAAGAVVMAAVSPWLIHSALRVPDQLQAESLLVFYLLAASLPLVTSTAGLRGVLEADQRFGALNAIRTPLSMLSYGGPLLVLPFSRHLAALVAPLVIGRVIGMVAHLGVCLQAFPELRKGPVLRRAALRPVLRLGAWLTVSNIIGPLMVYLDRLALGAAGSMTAVAYYTAPSEIVGRLAIIPTALVSVLFPAFASSFIGDRTRTVVLLRSATQLIFAAAFPIVLVLVLFAPEGLRWWLGPVFAEQGAPVLRWLAIGTFINALAQVPFTFVQAAGRPDITAKLHMIELPIYMVALRWAIGGYGIEGVAVAWTARITVDALFVFVVARRILKADRGYLWQSLSTLTTGLLILGLAALVSGTPSKVLLLLVAVAGLAVGVVTRTPIAAQWNARIARHPASRFNPFQ